MASTTKLLTIAIPTYNRGDFLHHSLSSALEACANFSDEVEVIVSDNCSTDNTQYIVNSFTLKYPYLFYYRNEKNLGMNANFYQLTDKYATGKYCWLLGDDDIIDKNMFPFIFNILKNNDIDFLKLSFDIRRIEDINDPLPEYIDNAKYYINGSFGEITNINVCSSNILNTFISASIFRLEPFKKHTKPSNYLVNNWNSFEEVFSHACIHAIIFNKSTNAIFLSYPTLSVCQHEKDWDDKMTSICTVYLPKLYYFYLKQGVHKKDLSNTKKIIVKDCMLFLLKGKKSKKTFWTLWFLMQNITTAIKVVFSILILKFK